MSKFQAPKGVSEYFPPNSDQFEFVRDKLINSAKLAGYSLIELPVFEDTEVFTRGVGESTDVVSKEMYTFEDRGGRSITLRPEGTAGVMRAVIEHNLDRGQLPVKLFYTGPFFRAERPQAGRYRQFYQVGIEAIGYNDPEIDVEVIAVADSAFKALGLKQYKLNITSLGDSSSRAAHRTELVKFISTLKLDDETIARSKLNPLRLFDDKRDEIKQAMAKAPLLLDFLNSESKSHFEEVKRLLTEIGIEYTINPRMVRGLDYYTGTTFEFDHALLGAQSGIGGGGRYDGLMNSLGGSDVSGIGFGLGVDRILMAALAENSLPVELNQIKLFIVPITEQGKNEGFKILSQLRAAGITCDMAYGDRGLKGGMKAADKSRALYSLVIGDDEISNGKCDLKLMSNGQLISSSLTASELIKRVGNSI
ncbi:MAG: histidine--tRNA ligase [Actinobacteria bacterium]|uniref:histidine--tRNA ligase n=2 Tax=freshwater metagenome TaxID=449393 RepID=A0A6J7U8Y6_9ZZZZ|nr:histidine--tRNA ligase [Actinomycetota bacterium]